MPQQERGVGGAARGGVAGRRCLPRRRCLRQACSPSVLSSLLTTGGGEEGELHIRSRRSGLLRCSFWLVGRQIQCHPAAASHAVEGEVVDFGPVWLETCYTFSLPLSQIETG